MNQKKMHSISPFLNYAGYRRLTLRKQQALEAGINDPFFKAHEGVNECIVYCQGRELINFSSYNYLGLSGHPLVSKAAKSAIDQYGTSVSASRIVSGQIPLHEQLEHDIAHFLGTEQSLVFISGYGTNVAVIGHLFGRHDLVIHDELAHNSIIMGCKLSGAHRISFPHSDWEALDALLIKHRSAFHRVLVVIESVYSMDGDIPNLLQAIEIKQRHNAMLMVDEAHSLGVLGPSGRGIGELFDINRDDVDIWMGTLSKSLGSSGGYIAGSHELIDYLRYLGSGFIYSVGLSPPDTAAALAALGILRNEPERVSRLRSRCAYFYERAKGYGLKLSGFPETPVAPLIIGHSLNAMRLSQRLFNLGIQVHPIVYPAVSEDKARLRFFVTSMHSEEQIEETLKIVARELPIIENAK